MKYYTSDKVGISHSVGQAMHHISFILLMSSLGVEVLDFSGCGWLVWRELNTNLVNLFLVWEMRANYKIVIMNVMSDV